MNSIMLCIRFPLLFRLSILQGIWVGMIGGTAVQTLILAYITLRCDWNAEVWFSSATSIYQIVSQNDFRTLG
jgi:hypothetical protein